MNKLRIGVIGLRTFGRSHIDGIQNCKNADLKIVCDILPDIAEKTSKEFNVPYCLDYQEVLCRADIDAVTIALPDQLHEAVTVAALHAGKHVLCEKPMALTTAECKNMIKAADETGSKLMVGQICRYTPGFQMAKEMVEKGEIGELFFVESEYAHDYSKLTEATWRFDPANPRHPIIGGGCHAVDLLRWIAGNPTEVFSYSNHKVLKDWPVNDATVAVIKFPNDVIGKVFNSIGCKRSYTMRTVLYGDKGTIVVDSTHPWLSLYQPGEGKDEYFYDVDAMRIDRRIPVAVNNHNIRGEISEFCDQVINDLPIKTNGVEGASTVAVCEAIVRSAETGEKQTIEYNFS